MAHRSMVIEAKSDEKEVNAVGHLDDLMRETIGAARFPGARYRFRRDGARLLRIDGLADADHLGGDVGLFEVAIEGVDDDLAAEEEEDVEFELRAEAYGEPDTVGLRGVVSRWRLCGCSRECVGV